jgi:hypothetical protein
MPTAEITKERRTMRAHPNLVLQVIKSQAGTLAKAALEGVMNAIDGKADNIIVTITAIMLRIEDDGVGFAGKKVREVFEEFGNPHPMDENGFSTDAKFGKFRIGRGQMFAFGKNTWRSINYRMYTDIDRMGLEYDYEEGHPNQPGCVVEIELYEPLNLREIQNTVDQITKFCRYTDRNLTVNGVSVAADPTKMKWDIVHDLAYINKKVTEHRWRSTTTGLDVYQQGVFVETLPVSEFGLEGTIVIRDEVGVNFARNQVLRRCPQWKKVAALLKQEGLRDIEKKKKLTRDQARSFVEEFSGGDGDVTYESFFDTACMPDVTGKLWSGSQILKLINSRSDSPRIKRDADGCILLGFAPKGNKEAAKVMDLKRGLVLDDAVLEQLRLDHIKDPEKQGLAAVRAICGLDNTGCRRDHRGNPIHDRFDERLKWADYTTLLNDIEDREYHRLSQDDWTDREDDILSGAQSIMYWLDHELHGYKERENRVASLGVSELSTAWTDGATCIAFDRTFLNGLQLHMERDWFELGILIASLYARSTDSTQADGTRDDIEYLQNFKELVFKLPNLCRQTHQTHINKLLRRGGKLPKNVQGIINKEAEAYAHQLVAYKAEAEQAAMPPVPPGFERN